MESTWGQRGAGSRLVARTQGSMPAIERTEGEKIRLAKSYLEKHGFYVLPKLLTVKEVATYLDCSVKHIVNLQRIGEFPIPFDIGANATSIDRKHRASRWRSDDITNWLGGRRI